jgi:hypothetical protein
MVAIHSCIQFSVLVLNEQLMTAASHREKLLHLTQICQSLLIPTFAAKFDLASPSLLQSIVHPIVREAKLNSRTGLIVAGAHFEDQVMICVLSVLAEGLDVFVLTDLLNTKDLDAKIAAEQRLFPLGVVPTTLRQALTQWCATEEFTSVREIISDQLRLIGQ